MHQAMHKSGSLSRPSHNRTGNSAQGTAVTPGGKSAEGGERGMWDCEGSSGQKGQYAKCECNRPSFMHQAQGL